MSGSPRHPRKRLAKALLAEVYASKTHRYVLGERAGWTQGRTLSYLTAPDAVIVATPLTTARLQMLALILGYSGPLFEEDGEAAAAQTYPAVNRRSGTDRRSER